MTRPSYEANDYRMCIRPHFGIRWQTTADQVHQEVTMQLQLFCLRLPITRRIAYSDVVHLAVVNREAWWTRFQTARGFSKESFMFRVGTPDYRTPMPTIGSRYDILMTLRGGKPIKIETVTSSDAARCIEKQLQERIGLPEVH